MEVSKKAAFVSMYKEYWLELRNLKRPINIATLPTIIIGTFLAGAPALGLALYVIFELFIRYIDDKSDATKRILRQEMERKKLKNESME